MDDHRDAADPLSQLFGAHGADVTAVYTSKPAVEVLQIMQPQAVVLDIGMPEMDGCEVAYRIRKMGGKPSIQLTKPASLGMLLK